MITTVDNPFDPILDFNNWYNYDMTMGYNTCAYLGRIVKVADAFTDEENRAEQERAIDEIIRLDPFDIYRKVIRNVEEDEPDQ